MNSAIIAADYILATSEQPLTPLQVNKLTYISHGFTLAIYNERLVYEKVEAWQYGPVFPTLYYALRDYGSDYIQQLLYCKTDLDDAVARVPFLKARLDDKTEVINMVLATYGKLSASRLIALTHAKGTPWRKCYDKTKRGTVIPTSLIREHYQDIIHGLT